MRVYKTSLTLVNEDGSDDGPILMDTIEHGGAFWLVPNWIDQSGEGLSKPERIVPLAPLDHFSNAGGDPRFVVNGILPKAVFYGTVPQELAPLFQVVLNPDVLIPRLN